MRRNKEDRRRNALGQKLVSGFGRHLSCSQLAVGQLTAAVSNPDLMAKFIRLVKNPELELAELQDRRRVPRGDNNLIHGMYRTCDTLLTRIYGSYRLLDMDSQSFHWIGPEQPPAFDPSNPDIAVVLEATFGSLPATLRFIEKWLREEHRDFTLGPSVAAHRWMNFASIEKFQRFSLRWRCLDLTANLDFSPQNISHEGAPPGLALLYLAAEHPRRMEAILRDPQAIWIDGLTANARPGESLVLQMNGDGSLHLDLVDRHKRLARSASPTFHVKQR